MIEAQADPARLLGRGRGMAERLKQVTVSILPWSCRHFLYVCEMLFSRSRGRERRLKHAW